MCYFSKSDTTVPHTSSDSLVLVHSTLGSHREAGLVPDSKVSISTKRQFYQLSDGAKSFESPALFTMTDFFVHPSN